MKHTHREQISPPNSTLPLPHSCVVTPCNRITITRRYALLRDKLNALFIKETCPRWVYLLLATLLLLVQPLWAEADNPGENLYKSRCGICHQLPDPDMLTAGQWRIVLQTMQKRMGHIEMSPLSESERELILTYLARYARIR